jgi:hypothetical protein
VTNSPAGDTPALMTVAELAARAGYTRAHVYQSIKAGRAPALQGRKGVLAEEATAWLTKYSRKAKRAAKRAARKELKQQLQEFYAAATAPERDV